MMLYMTLSRILSMILSRIISMILSRILSGILYMTLSRISCREPPLPSSQLIALSPLPGCSRPSARRDDGAPPVAVARLRRRCSCMVGLRFIVGVGGRRGCTRGGPAGR